MFRNSARASGFLAVLVLAACSDPTGVELPQLRGVRPASFYSRNFPLAFTSTRDGNMENYSMQTDNSATRRLTNMAGTDARPAFSPDGRNLLFISRRTGGDQDIWTSLDDGRKPLIVMDNTGFDESTPAWSPDAANIVFSTNRDGNFEIYRMTATGTNLVRLTTNTVSDTYTSWSTSNVIAFQRFSGGRIEIYLINADGTGERQLTTIGGSQPHWFPSGQRLAFVAPVNGVSQIFYVDVNTANPPVQVTFSPGNKWYPAVDVDGLIIAFSSAEGSPTFDIWTVNVDGTGETRMALAPGDEYFPNWR